MEILPPNPVFTSVNTGFSPFENLANKESDYYSIFAEKVLQNSPEAKNLCVRQNLHASRILQQIGKIFSKIFTERKQCTKNGYTLVLGNTGIGKSLFVGYMLEEKIIKIKFKGKGFEKWIYKFEGEEDDRLPVIGHLESKTKGCSAYEGYIDTAGHSDTEGSEAEMCNAAALHIFSQSCSPRRLVLIMSSSEFTNARGQEL